MASFLTIQIESRRYSVEDMNKMILDGDSTKPREILIQIRNYLDAINSGASALVYAVASSVSGTVSGQTGGDTVYLNLL